MAGVVHFTNLLTYVEEAEHAALISVGIKPISNEGGFPKVKVETCSVFIDTTAGDSTPGHLPQRTGSRPTNRFTIYPHPSPDLT